MTNKILFRVIAVLALLNVVGFGVYKWLGMKRQEEAAVSLNQKVANNYEGGGTMTQASYFKILSLQNKLAAKKILPLPIVR